MKYGTGFIYFNLAYAFGLICFLILLYFKIEIIFITNFIIIMSITLLIVKLLYWYSIKKTQQILHGIDKQKYFILKLICCIFSYITPVYYIIQESSLIVSHYVLTITFTIVTILAMIGMIIERKLFLIETQQSNNDDV